MGTHFTGTAIETSSLDLYIKLSRAAETVTQRINHHLQDENLTISQFGVLEALYFLGPLQPGQLAQKILKSGGNMTLVVNNLIKRGLVTRQRRENDRRCIEVQITPQGTALIAAIFPNHVAEVVETMGALSSEERQQLAALLKKLGLSAAGE
ncbi:MAG: MarR family transcriptional regulator [Candidatus Promineifilaceae bacterium]|nr:MarR family transcriptional regulator [Candidatus Promineifilaceae bacterium]